MKDGTDKMDNEVKVMSQEDLEMVCMEIISNSGEARAHVYTALDLFLDDKYEEADKELEETIQYEREHPRKDDWMLLT